MLSYSDGVEVTKSAISLVFSQRDMSSLIMP